MGGSTLRGNTTQKVFSLGKGPKPHRILLILRCQRQTVWLQPPFFFVAGHFDHPLRPGSLSLQCWVKAFVSMLGLQGMRKSSAGGCLEQWGHCRWWFVGNDPQMAELVWYTKYGNFPGIKNQPLSLDIFEASWEHQRATIWYRSPNRIIKRDLCTNNWDLPH